MKARAFLPWTLCAVMALAACSGDSSPSEPDNGDNGANPQWLTSLIGQIQSQPVTNPPTEIRSYRYRGETVYYRSGRCCDVWSELYDRNGALLCHPDGGFTGRGDGRCPDFREASSDATLIWHDPR